MLTSKIEMTQSKADHAEEVRSNLPLPEQPPVASDWNSADARTVNVGSGGVQSDVSTGAGSTSGLREPASKKDVDLSSVGRQGKDNLEGPPKDAKSN
ncbi:gamma-tubulin [Hypoxylon texense]